MIELTIETQTAKAGHVRIEYFDSMAAAAERRTMLKAIEIPGSSNTYKLQEVTEQVPAHKRHRRTY